MIVIVAIVAIVLIVLLLLYYEKNHLFYHIKYALSIVQGTHENSKGLPTPEHVGQSVVTLLNSIQAKTYTLLDFGCGDGDMIEVCLPHVHHVIGIELDQLQAQRTKERFHGNTNVTIHAMDMMDYQFEDIPSVLYVYEPLWMMERDDALSIYHKVFSSYRSVSHAYVIYVSRLISPLLDESFFKQHSYAILHQSRVKRILGWDGNYLYMLKRS